MAPLYCVLHSVVILIFEKDKYYNASHLIWLSITLRKIPNSLVCPYKITVWAPALLYSFIFRYYSPHSKNPLYLILKPTFHTLSCFRIFYCSFCLVPRMLPSCLLLLPHTLSLFFALLILTHPSNPNFNITFLEKSFLTVFFFLRFNLALL